MAVMLKLGEIVEAPGVAGVPHKSTAQEPTTIKLS